MHTFADRWGIHPRQFWLRGERPEQPVRFNEKSGMWDVYGYPEILRILGDPVTFSSDLSRLLPDGVDTSFNEGNLVQLDAPEHRKLRKLVGYAFTPRVVADLAPRIEHLTHELLDSVADHDEIELVADLAYPLPVIVIAELLGVPSADRDLFRQWAAGILGNPSELSVKEGKMDKEALEREFQKQKEPLQALSSYMREHAAERRRRPRPDLLTGLVQAQVDGERLTDNQVVNFANLLLLAGHVTTTMLLGNTVLCLDLHPAQAGRVRADRDLVPPAIEESLRLLSPFAMLGRRTTTEVDIGGNRVPPDQMLITWVGAANRDPRRFDRPDEFEPTRDPNPHLAFGRGVHFCLGAPLARLEGRIALNLLLDRFPSLRTDPGRPPQFMLSPDITGVRALPLQVR